MLSGKLVFPYFCPTETASRRSQRMIKIQGKFKDFYNDIRFWIILFFLIRLTGITNPPLEVAHHWRQTTVTMVARNFLEVDNNIFYPRIDIAGNKTGITGMEFPLLNYLIYLVSLVFGYAHWYGRLINLVASSAGIFFFYKLIIKYFDPKVAFYAAWIVLFSIWFAYSRKIMPDTFSMSLIITGMYYGSNYLDNQSGRFRWINLILYAVFLTLGILAKLPAGYLPAIFLLFFFNRHIPLSRKIVFSTVSVVSILIPAAWYFFWTPWLVETYGFWHFFMGKDILQGFQEISENLPQTLNRFYESAIKYVGFAFFLFGLSVAFWNKDKLLAGLFLISFPLFLVTVFKAGYTFPHHSYYIIPFVPVMALFAAIGISRVKTGKMVFIILAAIALEGVLNQYDDFFIPEKQKVIVNLEKDLDKVSGRNDLVLINSGYLPTPMYFAHRKGWVLPNEDILNKVQLQELIDNDLQFIVILKRTFGTLITLELPIVFENENYCIYRIQGKAG